MPAGRPSRKARIVWGVAIIACVLAACWPRYAFVTWRDERIRLAIPREVGVGDPVWVYSDIGLFSACAAAVYELQPETLARLRAAGLHALTEPMATHSRVTGRPIPSGWQATPYVSPHGASRGEDLWAYALSCTPMDGPLRRTVDAALDRPGAYFRLLDKAAVLVVPAAGIVMYVSLD
jgi:hypothetical protein